MMKKSVLLIVFSACVFLFSTCKKGEHINIFSIEDDKKFGAQASAYIDDSLGSRVLNPASYPISYGELNKIRDYVLASGSVTYKTQFPWRIRIIREDTTLNAFCTPGGYIYVYTGLIRYLDSEDHLAGVMGHEMAHADRRHSTAQLTQTYGLSILLDITLGKTGALKQVVGGLTTLKFSRNHEAEADEYSVKYLCQDPASFEADGAAGFFQKLIEEGNAGRTPEFLSTHPSPTNRVQAIEAKAIELGCDVNPKNPSGFAAMKSELGL